MNKDNNEIVVLRYFDNAVEANIAKTKLDAYGIPCFLTEENMAGLYPGHSLVAFRMRLHLFASDRDRAEQILRDEVLAVHDENIVTCPRCHSTRVSREFPESKAENIVYILFGVFLPHKKVNKCIDCGLEF